MQDKPVVSRQTIRLSSHHEKPEPRTYVLRGIYNKLFSQKQSLFQDDIPAVSIFRSREPNSLSQCLYYTLMFKFRIKKLIDLMKKA